MRHSGVKHTSWRVIIQCFALAFVLLLCCLSLLHKTTALYSCLAARNAVSSRYVSQNFASYADTSSEILRGCFPGLHLYEDRQNMLLQRIFYHRITPPVQMNITFPAECFTSTGTERSRACARLVLSWSCHKTRSEIYGIPVHKMQLYKHARRTQLLIRDPEYRRRVPPICFCRCLAHREDAFVLFSKIGSVTSAGKCNGSRSTLQRDQNKFQAIDGTGPWTEAHKLYRKYKFGLVFENTVQKGYVSEKILNAFLGGTVPIYHGTEDVFKVFRSYRSCTLIPHNPEKSIERFVTSRDNYEYRRMISQPILAEGVYDRFFALYGKGHLNGEIRALLGLPRHPVKKMTDEDRRKSDR